MSILAHVVSTVELLYKGHPGTELTGHCTEVAIVVRFYKSVGIGAQAG